jgi:hypothetical protein
MWRKTLAAALVIVACSAVVWAWQGDVGVHASPGDGVDAHGWMDASGATYVKTRVDGYSVNGSWVYCSEGFNDGGWCADNAHWNTYRYVSRATMQINIVPSGCFYGTAYFWEGGNYQGVRRDMDCYEPDPAQECADRGAGWQWIDGECVYSSPIVISTGKDRAYRFTSAAEGVAFDIDGDGQVEQLGWTVAGDDVAFLALDRNGNGTIDNGTELFGNHTVPGVPNGFEALRALNGGLPDGSIDAGDTLYASLLLWRDRNHNGQSEVGELSPVSDTIEAIGLGYFKSPRKDGFGNLYSYRGWARRHADGASSNTVVWGNNIVWGTAAAERVRTEPEREFAIYDVFLAMQ